ncbi:MAG: class I SAM-dependent methyltransferase [archaeon]
MVKRFNFGINWSNFSENSLNKKKFNDAVHSLNVLIGQDTIKGKSFLDIGCGSGIFSLAARVLKAKRVVGFDISKESIDTSNLNKKRLNIDGVTFFRKSILDNDYRSLGTFDIIYSWGVLHHTGKMWEAIKHSSELVRPKGHFVIAIYNRHWSSVIWKLIKFTYNQAPTWIKKMSIFFFFPVLYLGKLVTTMKNPLKKQRGMSFYYDVVDWIGGYPYEYASKKEIKNFVESRGLRLIKYIKSTVPTGCNEFVFEK